uniref:Methyltransferase n=1 Tax=viral metagenome TaxID=1070528 RepID=A0A6C0KMZ4_9ZZZZ
MYRTNCVICDSTKFEHVYTFPNYPITQNSSSLDISHDEFKDSTFVSCIDCGCVQLKTLIDPIKLYENCNRLIDATPTWKEHHKLFSDFIIENNKYTTILEIGSSTCPLYKLLKHTGIHYTTMDIADSEGRPSEVPFIQGNCEDFDFTGHSSLILSHTFEHLYNPRKFLKNIHDAKVKSVFISIPNIDELYSSENISILNNEHTFYVGNKEIVYMFSQIGYLCNNFYKFKNHSLFYHFVNNSSAILLPLENKINLGKNMQKIFIKYENIMKNIRIDKPCFICPGAHYGQKIYYYLQNYSKYIEGFIDNDPLKQGKRVYGTPCNVYSPDILTKYKETTVYIILYAGPYTEELKKQLNLLHPSIKYITLE